VGVLYESSYVGITKKECISQESNPHPLHVSYDFGHQNSSILLLNSIIKGTEMTDNKEQKI
jgi:hypothetical protein